MVSTLTAVLWKGCLSYVEKTPNLEKLDIPFFPAVLEIVTCEAARC